MTRWYRALELLVENQSYTTAIDVWASAVSLRRLGVRPSSPAATTCTRHATYRHPPPPPPPPTTPTLTTTLTPTQLRLIIDVLGTPTERTSHASPTSRPAVPAHAARATAPAAPTRRRRPSTYSTRCSSSTPRSAARWSTRSTRSTWRPTLTLTLTLTFTLTLTHWSTWRCRTAAAVPPGAAPPGSTVASTQVFVPRVICACSMITTCPMEHGPKQHTERESLLSHSLGTQTHRPSCPHGTERRRESLSIVL